MREDPVLDLNRRYRAARAAADKALHQYHRARAKLDHTGDALAAIVAEILTTPARSAAGAAVKLCLVINRVGDRLNDEDEALLDAVLVDLDRIAEAES